MAGPGRPAMDGGKVTMPIKAILMDIEGTTSAISFVHETLFPYARQHMDAFVREHASRPEVQTQLDAVSEMVGTPLCLDMAIETLCQWIDEDRKATPLKALQGMIWARGYGSGELKGHVYPDVVPALKAWHEKNLGLYVYSSGSVQAQKLIFGHTEYGDLTPMFSGYFDTTVGHKREADSYLHIAEVIGLPCDEVLFLSDIVQELDAASEAGMHTTQLVRPGEGVAGDWHPIAIDFSSINPE